MSRLGDEVARMRLAKGLTQKQLAKLAGVAEAYIQDVESGKRVMNDQLASRISKLLGGHFGSEAPEMAEPEPVRAAPRPLSAAARAAGNRQVAPQAQVVYSTEAQNESADAAKNPIWSEAFSQMLREVPVYDPLMRKQTGTRTMAVVSGKIEGQPKEKVFWVEMADNAMIGYRIQRTDVVFGVETRRMDGDGFYFIAWNGQRAIRQLKAQPGGMIQIACHKGAPVRETVAITQIEILGRMLRVEVSLA
jgi:transcriptional regulator with XRE-family HTH domain